VTIKDDLRSAEVVLECLDRSGPRLRKVQSLTVETDRSILADAGLSFHLDRKSREAKAAGNLDQAAAAAALARRREAVPVSTSARPELVQVSVLINGAEVSARAAAGGEAQGVLPMPRVGQLVSLKLKNVSPHPLGVLLRVGGRSTIAEQTDEGTRCRRWVLEPGKERVIKGYYTGEGLDRVVPFKLPGGAGGELAPGLQNLVEVQVYVPGDHEERRRSVSLRGLSPLDRRPGEYWTFKTLHEKLKVRAGLKKAGARGMEPEDTPPPVVEKVLQNATFAECLRLRFDAE